MTIIVENGGASRWWLHQSLVSLNASLDGRMVFENGETLSILRRIIDESGVKDVFWNRCCEPWRIVRDGGIKEELSGVKEI